MLQVFCPHSPLLPHTPNFSVFPFCLPHSHYNIFHSPSSPLITFSPLFFLFFICFVPVTWNLPHLKCNDNCGILEKSSLVWLCVFVSAVVRLYELRLDEMMKTSYVTLWLLHTLLSNFWPLTLPNLNLPPYQEPCCNFPFILPNGCSICCRTFFMYIIAVVSSEQMRTDGTLYNSGLCLNLIHWLLWSAFLSSFWQYGGSGMENYCICGVDHSWSVLFSFKMLFCQKTFAVQNVLLYTPLFLKCGGDCLNLETTVFESF